MAILKGRYNKIKVTVDDETVTRARMLLCTLANGCCVGGQYNCAPRSQNDDGLIEVCLFHSMSLFAFLGLLGPYTEGRHLDMDKFSKRTVYRRAKHVEITSEKEIEICLDGEMLAGREFKVDILPGAIHFILPEGILPKKTEQKTEVAEKAAV